MKKFKPIDIFPGNVPKEKIYKTLEIDLEAGIVKFSAPAQKHAYGRHGEELKTIIPHLSEIISDPMYMGDDYKNPGKIELVRRIRGENNAALIALKIEKADDGYYHVCSAYFISQSEVDKKKQKKILKIVL